MRCDDRGVTAIEFGLVFPPFLLLVSGIFGVSLFFLTHIMLDQALKKSARQIRTGQSVALPSGELKVGALRTQICNAAGGLISCSKLRLHIHSPDSWDENVFTPPSCIANGAMAPSTLIDTDNVSKSTGRSTKNVFILACYPWSLWASLPYFGVGNVQNGEAQLIQTSIAFKIEQFE